MFTTRLYSVLLSLAFAAMPALAARAQSGVSIPLHAFPRLGPREAVLDSTQVSPTEAPQFTPYHLLKKTVIGGEGGWDYLTADPLGHRLYVAHGTQVDVYNIDGDSLIGHVPHTEGVHGVAIAPREHHGFVSCGKSNSVLMFNLQTLDTVQRFSVGEKPDAIIFDPASWHIFVMNGKSESISTLDAANGRLISTIKLPGAPESAVADQRGHVFVNLEDKSKVIKIDSRQDTIMAVWPLGSGEGPTGLAMDRATDRLFIGCGNQKMVVMNAKNGAIIATLPIGKGVDAVDFDPYSKLAFSSNGEGNVTIVREAGTENFQVVQTLITQRGARTCALDLRTHDLYLATAEFGPAPAATPENPRPRPTILPGTFTVLKYGQEVK